MNETYQVPAAHGGPATWLAASAGDRQALYRQADAVRQAWVGPTVHLRALVEMSNHCRRDCGYCGLRRSRKLPRYRMTDNEVLVCARQAATLGLGTLVLQAGEDPALSGPAVASLVRRVRGETGLAVTLSLGERPQAELAAWRGAGADRYLLRFETCSPPLFAAAHPDAPAGLNRRLAQLQWLDALGYQVGSGFLVGLPGQTRAHLAADLALVARLRLHMVGLGPFLMHPDTPLGRSQQRSPLLADAELVLTCLALARLACPWAQIPATSALQVASGDEGLVRALLAGASVIMPDFTPMPYRLLYAIYPGKGMDPRPPAHRVAELRALVESMGRSLGVGPGHILRPAPSQQGGTHEPSHL